MQNWRPRGSGPKATFTQAGATTRSDEGFSVTYEDRLHVGYREGAKTMRVAVEYLATDGVVVELVSIRAWDPPFERESLEPERIAVRVRDALAFRGLDASIDKS